MEAREPPEPQACGDGGTGAMGRAAATRGVPSRNASVWRSRGLLPNMAAGAAEAVRRREERDRRAALAASGETCREAYLDVDHYDPVEGVFVMTMHEIAGPSASRGSMGTSSTPHVDGADGDADGGEHLEDFLDEDLLCSISSSRMRRSRAE